MADALLALLGLGLVVWAVVHFGSEGGVWTILALVLALVLASALVGAHGAGLAADAQDAVSRFQAWARGGGGNATAG